MDTKDIEETKAILVSYFRGVTNKKRAEIAFTEVIEPILKDHEAEVRRAVEEEWKRHSPLRAIVKQFYQYAREYEEYTLLAEVDAMAFRRDTHVWPPGKSAPVEMHLEPREERYKMFDEWCKSVDALLSEKSPTKTDKQ